MRVKGNKIDYDLKPVSFLKAIIPKITTYLIRNDGTFKSLKTQRRKIKDSN